MASLVVSQLVLPSGGGAPRPWEDPSFIKWRKRDAHVTLHCHESVEGSLRFWRERSKVDFIASKSAVWNDDAVAGALESAAFWVDGLPYVKSLSGYWRFFLAPDVKSVPDKFYESEFQDSTWEKLTDRRILLHFEAVDSAFYAWVNGVLVGYSQWFQQYQEFSSNPFYATGESYAGVYVPTLASAIVAGNEAGRTPIINIKGYMVGNGVTDPLFDANVQMMS